MDYLTNNKHVARATEYVHQKVKAHQSQILPAIVGIGAFMAGFMFPGSAHNIALYGIAGVGAATGVSVLGASHRRLKEDMQKGMVSFDLAACSPNEEDIEKRINKGEQDGPMLRGSIAKEKLVRGLKGVYESSQQGIVPTAVAVALLVGSLLFARFGSPILNHLNALTNKVSWLSHSNLLALGAVIIGGMSLSYLMDRILKRKRASSIPLTRWAQKAWSYLSSRDHRAEYRSAHLRAKDLYFATGTPESCQSKHEIETADL